uniref:Testis expressed gene 101 n=2 Tax=Nannospalax galili TaxID=1026970 RepID=A0A8C6QZN0_NANGA
MEAFCMQYVQFFFVLGTSSWTLAQPLHCEVGRTLSLEEDPGKTFNWTSDKVESCVSGTFCQETLLLIKAARTKTAVLATKSCVPEGPEAMTFVQYTSPPGVIAISYSNYCNNILCNNRTSISQFWRPLETPVSSLSATLRCPTCVALGSCPSAPSQPCPNGTVQCYQGRIELTGGGIDSSVEVKGCTTTTGCRLMARISTIGPMSVKEFCTYQPFLQPRKAENKAPWLLASLWMLELLPLLLLPLTHLP